MANKKTVNADLSDGVTNLEEFYAALAKITKSVGELRKRTEKEAAEAYNKAVEKAIKKNASLRNKYEAVLHDIKDAHILAEAKKEKEERLKVINAIYEDQVKKLGKYGKQQKKEEGRRAAERYDENRAWLKQYKNLEKQGIELTEEQLSDRAKRESEVRIAENARAVDAWKESFDKVDKSLRAFGNKFVSGIDNAITKYTEYQTGINARLQGATVAGQTTDTANYFTLLERTLQSSVGLSSYIKTEAMMDNLQSLVEKGIVSNVEQRAFLNTLKDSIATTFDAADSALLRIIRLQQSDSTAMRLGMEAFLTRYMNDLVSNTEYLNSTFDSVAESLIQASSLMSSSVSTQFEFVVQKWLGALTGVGLSEQTATSIAKAIGQLGSGDVSVVGTDIFRLFARAATTSSAGLDIGTLMRGGFTDETANSLLRSVVDYMIEIGSSGDNVTKSQLASAFGLSVSDLVAAGNIRDSLDSLTNQLMSTDEMYGELGYQIGELSERIPTAVKLDTLFENLQFRLGSGIAGDPVSAALWKVNSMIEEATGGINLPAISVFGSGVDLNANLNQLMKLGLVGASSLGLIFDIAQGATNGSGSLVDALSRLGVGTNVDIQRKGSGLATRERGTTTSGSTYVGQGSSDFYYQDTLQQATASAKEIAPGVDDDQSKIMPEIHDYLLTKLDAYMQHLDNNVNSIKEKLNGGTIDVDMIELHGLVDILKALSIV